MKKKNFVSNKYKSVSTHVSTCIFQSCFNVVFRSVALITKVMGYFRFFFHRPDFFLPCTLPFKLKKKCLTKNSLNYFSLKKSKKIMVIVSKMRVLGKKTTGNIWEVATWENAFGKVRNILFNI